MVLVSMKVLSARGHYFVHVLRKVMSKGSVLSFHNPTANLGNVSQTCN